MPAAPAASLAVKKAHECSHCGHAGSPAFPAAMVLRFPSCSPRRPGLLSPSQVTMRKHCHRVDLSVGRSGPHDFAVREKHHSSVDAPTSIASRAHVRDDRETPLMVARDGRQAARDLPVAASEDPATNWHDGQISLSRSDSCQVLLLFQYADLIYRKTVQLSCISARSCP